MKRHQKILLFVLVFCVFCAMDDITYIKSLNVKKEKLRQEIKNNKIQFDRIPTMVSKQEQDSVKSFNDLSPCFKILNQKQQEKQKLQIRITQIAEKSWAQYYTQNFDKYKKYIDSCFSQDDIQILSGLVGVAHFSLSCDIDTNYYKTMDDILYGPYWRDFPGIRCSSPVIKKYYNVRRSAESVYPYIYTQSAFYDGGSIKKTCEKPSKPDVIFTDAIKYGVEYLYSKSDKPGAYMQDFNRLRNVSNVFTTDICYWVESLSVPDGEILDMKSPLFADNYDKILSLTKRIIVLDSEIKKYKTQHNKDVDKIKKHFEYTKDIKMKSASNQIRKLQIELSCYDNQHTR